MNLTLNQLATIGTSVRQTIDSLAITKSLIQGTDLINESELDEIRYVLETLNAINNNLRNQVNTLFLESIPTAK